MPTNVAARMTLAADPGSLQGAVAAGILGAGTVVLGSSEECARLLARARDVSPLEIARELHAAGEKLPGFGHPLHRPVDPRAERILELADERGVSGPNVALARDFREAAAEIWSKPLPLNVSMAIAAVLLDLGFPPASVKAIPILGACGEPPRASRGGAGSTHSASSSPGRRRRRSPTSRRLRAERAA